MPPYRTYNRRQKRTTRYRNTQSQKYWWDKKYSTRDIALQALNAAKYIKGLVNSEMFHRDTQLTLGSAQNGIRHLTAIPQGDGPSERTGNSILLRNIYIRGSIQINSSTLANTRVSLVLLKDTQQPSDLLPIMSDIFQDYTDPETMLSTTTFGRYKILWRRNYVLTPVSGGKNAVEIIKYWKVYDHVRYNGTTSSDIQKNGYYLVMLTSEITNYPTIILNTRIGYRDN